ncbi:mitochondrial protein C2orf69 homolog [Tympanuchus pallidicinctus]|uniref:mitochondrial protein C2orf69 homolog n=1 Tax=Tympanuchus pallidicinctus TaxID=109042 RepID=UPI00228711F0|nr:mitochondrial protein C2orf69 homolog [Tympanuchus pallidicinctus]
MSGRCRAGAASLLRGLIGPAALGLGGSMSLCGTPAACAAGPASGGGGGGGGGGFSSARLSPPWLRLPEVTGAEPQRANELLLLLPPAPRGPAPPQHHVVYFPGDVQNYYDIMSCHPENFQWEHWSFENVATILAHRFPDSFIWVVKCSRMHLHKFSCYDNFVASNMFGAPEHSTDFGAFKHLHALLVNAFRLSQNILQSQTTAHGFSKDAKVSARKSEPQSVPTANGCSSTEREKDCECSNNSAMNFIIPSAVGAVSFTLIGFSKGCVVLNQLLYELKEAKKDKNTNAFLKNIKAIYWLDGGHSGGSNTWVTYPEVLKELAQTGIEVHSHVTPYQVFDTMRSWIGREHEKFVQILEEFGVEINDQLHFADEVPSLDNHFRVHEVF